ncbi:class I poly(R)-hydroxyalkanoic acid synthase [Magnetovibrio sp.]|uniref:class I poly(R)-hydroxyalkanoic acid synthase n=1 Tax=Magnetovibrio sp. TaxID=2024836 RepID=UPI002F9236FC
MPDQRSEGPIPKPSDTSLTKLEELPVILADVAARSQDMIRAFNERHAVDAEWQDTARSELNLTEIVGLPETFAELTRRMIAEPEHLAQAQMKFWENGLKLLGYFNARLAGKHPDPVAKPDRGDKRFLDPDWSEDPYFDFLKQQYLLFSNWVEDIVDGADGLDPHERQKAQFFTRRLTDAMAPTNFLLTNPEALHETIETRGENLIRGLEMAIEDMEKGHGKLAVRTTKDGAFTIGKDLANTPGKVVFRNDLMELIQYAPSTDKVRKTPLLIVPPWINKFYILDLGAEKSFVRWAVEQGHTVFAISWVNPDESLKAKAFEDYLAEGPLAALDAIEQATGEREVNAIGYCIGGTLLATTLAYLAAHDQSKRIKSATFFTTLLDFSDVGELSVFIDEGMVSRLEEHMKDNGILSGREMASTFSLLRANDLIWSFAINSYLLGKDPRPFDILHWNADSTNMPAAMHAYYLRHMYLENRLRTKGGIEIMGTPIDLSKVKTPSYFLATKDDHIAPWKTVYESARLLKGPTKYVLAGSGHVAGVINPPSRKKYCHWTNGNKPDTPGAWLEGASQHPGSWWNDWNKWVNRYAGKKDQKPRTPGKGGLKALCDAPGDYVLKRGS